MSLLSPILRSLNESYAEDKYIKLPPHRVTDLEKKVREAYLKEGFRELEPGIYILASPSKKGYAKVSLDIRDEHTDKGVKTTVKNPSHIYISAIWNSIKDISIPVDDQTDLTELPRVIKEHLRQADESFSKLTITKNPDDLWYLRGQVK